MVGLGIPAYDLECVVLRRVGWNRRGSLMHQRHKRRHRAVIVGTFSLAIWIGVKNTRKISPHACTDWLADRARRGESSAVAITAGLPWVILGASQLLAVYLADHVIGDRALTAEQAVPPLWFVTVSALWAGLVEQLVVVALPIVVLAHVVKPRNFWSAFWAMWPILVVARMVYHAYYGWGFLQLLPWAMAVPILYALYRRVWPLVVMHVVYDVDNGLANLGYLPAALYVTVVLAVGGALTAAGIALKHRQATVVPAKTSRQ